MGEEQGKMFTYMDVERAEHYLDLDTRDSSLHRLSPGRVNTTNQMVTSFSETELNKDHPILPHLSMNILPIFHLFERILNTTVLTEQCLTAHREK